jgi:hypothetical protein
MASITAVVEDVTAKETAKGPIYNINAGGKKFSTFKVEIAEQAKRAVGINSVLGYTEKGREYNGKTYMDYYLDSVDTQGAAPATGGGFAPASGGFSKDESIARAVALKGAIEFQHGEGSVADVLMVANEFLAYLLKTPAAPASPAVAAFSGPSDDIPF